MGFSVTESVVGGSFVVTPIASLELTGSEGSRDRIWEFGPSLGKTYYPSISINMLKLDLEKITYNIRTSF